ncbi:MAG: hypothetical protein ACKVQB_00145 [Bacteroidia bacterium]
MKIKRYIYQLTIAFLVVVLFSTCKKEVTTTDSFTSFGRVFPIKGNQNIAGAIKTPDDGYLIWGNTNGGSHGKQDGFLLRLDKDYNQLWYKTYGGFSNDYFESATFDGQGNILAAGTSTSFGVSIDSASAIANPCMYAVYVTGNGELLWQKTYYGNPNPNTQNFSNALNKVLLLPNQNFALIGSTSNYLRKFGTQAYYASRAYIQCINKLGDTLWNSHYNYFDTISPMPDFVISYIGSNALLSHDGNIQMLMVKHSGGADNFPLSLIKISPNSTSGYNKYISRKPIVGFYSTYFFQETSINYFYPMQLVNDGQENYIVAAQSEMLFCKADGTIIKRTLISEDYLINDMLYKDGLAYFVSSHEIIKTDLNGTILWKSNAYDKLKIDKVKGIFMQKDNSISVFCSYQNTLKEKDIALLRLTESGQLILK